MNQPQVCGVKGEVLHFHGKYLTDDACTSRDCAYCIFCANTNQTHIAKVWDKFIKLNMND